MAERKEEGPYKISTRPKLTPDYKDGWVYYVEGPGSGGYYGGYYDNNNIFHLEIIHPNEDRTGWNQPDLWNRITQLMNTAYEEGRKAERTSIRTSICSALGLGNLAR